MLQNRRGQRSNNTITCGEEDESGLQAQVAAAKAYEEFFVPALFGEWAPRVAALAQIQTGNHVLDVACGTGVLAREAPSRVGPSGFVAAVDASPGMLTIAAALAPGIEWRQGTTEALPYPDRRFDSVVSQFGLMFFTDRPQAVSEMHRVLKRGGRLAVAVWASLDSAPAYAAEVALLERLAGKAAADALRAPFVLGDAKELAQLVASAGVEDIRVTTQPGVARFPSIRFMVEADLRGWLPLMGVVLAEDHIHRILGEAEETLGAYVTAAGRRPAGWRPIS
jgi:ubiquinone/menaquinone biosynthesis C-methylase UbiE